jgi:hypothetical protein
LQRPEQHHFGQCEKSLRVRKLVVEVAFDNDDDSVVVLVDSTWRDSVSIKNSPPVVESIIIRPGSSVDEKRVCAVCLGGS